MGERGGYIVNVKGCVRGRGLLPAPGCIYRVRERVLEGWGGR